MLIDVDPTRRSNRAELAVLHHDLAHNPENGFNFQIQWLGATARLVDELVQSWTRAVERYGLHLVEAPIAQIKDAGQQNLFHAPLQIRLAKPPPPYHVLAPLLERARCSRGTPPAPANEMEQWLFRHVLSHYMTQADQLFEIALLRHFHFVLDQEAMSRFPKHVDVYYSSRAANFDHTQFVHRSGVAFVQVLGGGDGFLWLNNRLFHASVASGKGAKASPLPDADYVRLQFQQVCDDADALTSFYTRVCDALERLAEQPADNVTTLASPLPHT